jgi:hypothetical protein
MTRQALINSIFRQTTILIAHLATSGGVRAPLAQVADRVFLDLSRELEQQGISRSVSADMFGMALRSYRRRLRQVTESSTEQGRSLWEAVLEFLSTGTLVTRADVQQRFHHDEEVLVKGVLNDLCESGLVFRLGSGKGAVYRAATGDEIAVLRDRSEGLNELVWAMVYREGPIDLSQLAERTSVPLEALRVCVTELAADGRIELGEDQSYRSRRIVVPLGASAGWEAALFDHFQAVVKTMCIRLREGAESAKSAESGGSTYTYSIWEGHPFEDEVKGLLREFRERHSALRERVKTYNEGHSPPAYYRKFTVYGGMCATEQDGAGEERSEEEQSNEDE